MPKALALERIAEKQLGLQILPEHYPYVAEALLAATRDVLGDVATDEILQAWARPTGSLTTTCAGPSGSCGRS